MLQSTLLSAASPSFEFTTLEVRAFAIVFALSFVIGYFSGKQSTFADVAGRKLAGFPSLDLFAVASYRIGSSLAERDWPDWFPRFSPVFDGVVVLSALVVGVLILQAKVSTITLPTPEEAAVPLWVVRSGLKASLLLTSVTLGTVPGSVLGASYRFARSAHERAEELVESGRINHSGRRIMQVSILTSFLVALVVTFLFGGRSVTLFGVPLPSSDLVVLFVVSFVASLLLVLAIAIVVLKFVDDSNAESADSETDDRIRRWQFYGE